MRLLRADMWPDVDGDAIKAFFEGYGDALGGDEDRNGGRVCAVLDRAAAKDVPLLLLLSLQETRLLFVVTGPKSLSKSSAFDKGDSSGFLPSVRISCVSSPSPSESSITTLSHVPPLCRTACLAATGEEYGSSPASIVSISCASWPFVVLSPWSGLCEKRNRGVVEN